METSDEIRDFLVQATAEGARGQLLARGAAWSIMRRDGVLPDDAPRFAVSLGTDLAEYGLSLLRAALKLRELEGPSALGRISFERAADAFHYLVRNGFSGEVSRGFYRTLCAASYHLAGFSAVAFSLFNEQAEDQNLSPAEKVLATLILRDLTALREFVRGWLTGEAASDAVVAAGLAADNIESDEAVGVILNRSVCRAMAYFDFALQTGDDTLVQTSRYILSVALRLAEGAGAVSLWWIIRLCASLLDDLWSQSLHTALPHAPPRGGDALYPDLRRTFIASLYGRSVSEVELWPSQREAARRATDIDDDLIVALPTSAGKTRVAEIAALMTLATEKRVLIVTPLRALSAQTERSFRKAFAPLGFGVSSLYGASGLSSGDEDALRTREIIISTPEKLDFALRSDPTLIDDVGLIVLDEGHLIGPSEREVRYEVLVQRLLRRADAHVRRIVCLSAILPAGEALGDLTAWIRADAPGEPIQSDWRPTRQKFGTIAWNGNAARLAFDLDEAGPFISRFVEAHPAIRPERRARPRDNKELTLFAAWAFAAQNKRTLIFCPQANWVEGYGETVCRLHESGYLPTLLEDPAPIARALEIGREWLGDGHPAVECLKVGVAVHHGRLPNPFLRELELLLAQGVLKVIIASPTLSQGLNLNAAVLLVPSLYRAGTLIEGEEFANVAGRAGRAFVDVEGLILHVMFDNHDYRKRIWGQLVASIRARTLQSGMAQIVAAIIARLTRTGILARPDVGEYLCNSREPWLALGEVLADGEDALPALVERLDAMVVGLIDALDADAADLPRMLDEALTGSLWARQVARETDHTRELQKFIIRARASVIWAHTTPATRRAHFAMGVGLEAGLAVDAMAEDLGAWLDHADLAAIQGDHGRLSQSLIALAERLLFMRPFETEGAGALTDGWQAVLAQWLSGAEVDQIGARHMRMIEEAFAYRLVWALEAVRMRRASLGWTADIVSGGAAACVETGLPQMTPAVLVRAGLPSRQTALLAVQGSEAYFFDPPGLREWLSGNLVTAMTDGGDWPSAATAGVWKRFRDEALGAATPKWVRARAHREIELPAGTPPPAPGVYRIEVENGDGPVWLTTPDFRRIARFRNPATLPQPNLLIGRYGAGASVEIERVGIGRGTWPAP